jgi:hypothetical protein
MCESHKNGHSDEVRKNYGKNCAASAWGCTNSNPLKPDNYHQTKVLSNQCMGLEKNLGKA